LKDKLHEFFSLILLNKRKDKGIVKFGSGGFISGFSFFNAWKIRMANNYKTTITSWLFPSINKGIKLDKTVFPSTTIFFTPFILPWGLSTVTW